jgi:hypothetical protein
MLTELGRHCPPAYACLAAVRTRCLMFTMAFEKGQDARLHATGSLRRDSVSLAGDPTSDPTRHINHRGKWSLERHTMPSCAEQDRAV